MSLTRATLVDRLAETLGLSGREALDLIQAFFEEIGAALERGESVKMSSFGNFRLRDKASRPGRNPKTGERIPVTARRVVLFHASQRLKTKIDQRHLARGRKPR